MQKCKRFVNMYTDVYNRFDTNRPVLIKKDVLRWQIKVQRITAMIMTSWSSHKDVSRK
jgi:hypothetical protein